MAIEEFLVEVSKVAKFCFEVSQTQVEMIRRMDQYFWDRLKPALNQKLESIPLFWKSHCPVWVNAFGPALRQVQEH